MLHLILAESELEMADGKLLDSSLHHRRMRGWPDAERRGRPDLVHFALTLALDSPAAKRGELTVTVHTRNNEVISIEPSCRLPKNYDRFKGLMEQLFRIGRVPPTGEPLMKLEKNVTLAELVKRLKPTATIRFDATGEPVKPAKLGEFLQDGTVLIVGGFPHGGFRQTVAAREISLADEELLAATIVGWLTGAME